MPSSSWVQRIKNWLPDLDYRVWILISGRLLSQLGTGFTLFYAPIFFVNQVGLSATAVGIGIGSASISGVLGRLLGGSFADSPRWGRRLTLLLSAGVSALADLFLVLADNMPLFVIGNLLMGFGIGLYWPATESMVADLTTAEQRNEAYALTRLGDNLGLGLGVVLGGLLIQWTGAYRALFVVDGISFLVFFVIIYVAIGETLNPAHAQHTMLKGWAMALRDRILLIYALVNTLFTTYLSQINSALPLYFSNFVSLPETGDGFSTATISALFSWHVALTAILQLPVARWLNRFTRPQALIASALFWGMGFVLIWITGVATGWHLFWAIISLTILAIAADAYTPAASSLVVGLAPPSLRGVYLSINSQCWAVGYFVGPTLGGWAMDQPRSIADGFWVVSAISVSVAIAVLYYLDRLMQHRVSI